MQQMRFQRFSIQNAFSNENTVEKKVAQEPSALPKYAGQES
jgi:hypothetical protein